MIVKRKKAEIWRNNNTERCCQKCKEWKPMHRDYWHVRASGYPIFARCRRCVNPNDRKPGRPVGAMDRTPRQRAQAGASAAHERWRVDTTALDPNALLKAAESYGLDPAKMSRWFNCD